MNLTKKDKKTPSAWVVAVLMGLGHVRGAYPLRDLCGGKIVVYGSRENTGSKEYRLWRRARWAYYALSKAEQLPVLGRFFKKVLSRIEKIDPYYPKKDLSKPTLAVKYLAHLIRSKGFCQHLVELVSKGNKPIIHTFYSTGIAMTHHKLPNKNYVLITDSDFNRVWVPKDPDTPGLEYLAPCTQVVKRLQKYGVSRDRIHLTGFPLPKENIGSRENMEVLKEDLFQRLVRLDPRKVFFSFHENSVFHWLKRSSYEGTSSDYFYLTFAIGGAGAQTNMIGTILTSMKDRIEKGQIRINLSAGVQDWVFEKILGFINQSGLQRYLDKEIRVIYNPDPFEYYQAFNRMLKTTDIMWSKPSEISFYSALGIPVLLAPSIGPQETLNKRWLEQIHAAVKPVGPLDCADEWIFDLRKNGRFAEAAWDGFLKGRKLGTYKIEDLVHTGKCDPGTNPLDR
jgi:hypothetical protein